MSYSVEPLGDNVCNLGEGPHWHCKSRSLYFVDAFVGDVHHMDVLSGLTNTFHFKDLVTIVIPFEDNNNNSLLVSLRNKVLKVDTKTGSRQVIATIGDQLEGKERFNDGKVDAMGRLWIGSVLDGPNGPVPQMGSLYKLIGNQMVKMCPNITLSNGITWNPSNTQMYFNDSGDQIIYVFDFDLQNGFIDNQKVFVDIKGNSDFKDNEFPDGMTTDQNGKLWVALYGGGRVVQINEKSGKVENYVTIPALLTTSVAFGGQDLNELFVTTGNDDQNMSEYPNAGKIFRITSTDPTFRAAKSEPQFKHNS